MPVLVRAFLLIYASVTALVWLGLGLALHFRILTTLGWLSAFSLPILAAPWISLLPAREFHPALTAACHLLNCTLLLGAERVWLAIEARDAKPRFPGKSKV